MTFDKTAYQREYMAKKRAEKPASQKARMTHALEQIAEALADSKTEKGQRLRQIALDALKPV